MRLRQRKRAWLAWLGKMMASAGCALAGIMLITAIAMSSAHGAALATGTSAAQDVISALVKSDDAGLVITETAIAAKEVDIAIAPAVAHQEVIQPGAEQSVPIAVAAVAPDIAGKEASATAMITSSIIYVALQPAHFQPAALTTA